MVHDRPAGASAARADCNLRPFETTGTIGAAGVDGCGSPRSVPENGPNLEGDEMGAKLLRANTVAEHMLWLRGDRPTTPLHIVKLVYLCQGWMLGIKGERLIDEPIVTGRYGPVVQSLYDRYAVFGDGQIVGVKGVDHSKDLNPAQIAIMNFVHAVYEEFPDTELSEITHEPGTPWSEIYKNQGLGTEIPEDLVRKHYQQLIDGIRQADNA